MNNKFFATCRLGAESEVAYELKSLGAIEVCPENGRVYFGGSFEDMARANICLRCAERIFLEIATFEANTFDELFEGIKALPLENYLPSNAMVYVKGKTAKSQLKSVSALQSITKKAIAERIMAHYKMNWLPETGNQYIIETGLLNNIATIALDASGAGLSRRGYRTLTGQAALSETLAATLLRFMRPGNASFFDPMCGSGTIAIEAALMAINKPPCLEREFAAQAWQFIPAHAFADERARAKDLILPKPTFAVFASDIDSNELELAKQHAKQAGVGIRFEQADACSANIFDVFSSPPLLLTNPPYGERLLDRKEAEELYVKMGKNFLYSGAKIGVFTAHPQFERFFGKRAMRRRKLTNGGINCQLYTYEP